MTVRFSNGLANYVAQYGAFKGALDGCVIDIYSGSQPATADTAASGTLLATLTKSSGAYTAEVRATGSITYSGSASATTIKISSAGIEILNTTVPYNTSVAQTATDIATAINRNPQNKMLVASTTGASGVITLTSKYGIGALLNGMTVTSTDAGLTGTGVSFSGGSAAVNGLTFDVAVLGVLSKNPTETWSANAGSGSFTSGTATAGWFRIRTSGDAGPANTPIRLDGALATSGGDINLGTLTVSYGAPFILSTFSITVPNQ